MDRASVLVAAAVIIAAIVLCLEAILRLPGIPYNVAELFLDNGSAWRLTLFVVALLWIGAGPLLTARWLRESRWPLLTLPFAMILIAMVSRTLLKYSVTYESLDDILGTNNLYSRIIGERIWGEFWRHALSSATAGDFVSYMERRVRFIALYSPLAVCLTLAFLPQFDGRQPRFGRTRIVFLIIAAMAWMWLSVTIVFTWPATDNLTELVAETGPFGFGGRLYLLLIAVLFAINVRWLLGAGADWRRWLAAIAFTVAAIPVGWWLLGLGLDQHIHKYGAVFSGAQFLLGADRRHTLGGAALFARWTAVQTAGVAVIFAGAWIADRLTSGSPAAANAAQSPEPARASIDRTARRI